MSPDKQAALRKKRAQQELKWRVDIDFGCGLDCFATASVRIAGGVGGGSTPQLFSQLPNTLSNYALGVSYVLTI